MMNLPGFMSKFFQVPLLTSARIWTALAVAAAADGVQILLGPLGWAFFDEAIDVVAMVVESYLIGFHFLFLPTFVVEFIPLADMLPTWTGCVAAVVALRKREQNAAVPYVRPVVATPPALPESAGDTRKNENK
jgi:hypothetical protein